MCGTFLNFLRSIESCLWILSGDSDGERTDGIIEVFIRVFRADNAKRSEDGRLLVRRGGHKRWIIR